MKEKKLNVDIYNDLCDQLPDFLSNYCYVGLSELGISTRISYIRDIIYFFRFSIETFPYFPEKKMKEITVSDIGKITANNINTYLMYMKEKYGLSEKTRARRKSAILSMYKYLINTEKKLEYNPVSGANRVKISQKDFVIYLTEDEQNILLNGIYAGTGLSDREMKLHKYYQKRDIAIIFLFLDMGLRISELNGIDISDVDLEDCSVIVNRKGNKYQKLWFSDRSKEYIKDYLEERKNRHDIMTNSSPLFVTIKGARLSIRAIQEMLNKYMNACLPDKAGIISVHKLRSSFAMQYYRKTDGDILSLQRKLGHASISTTNIYAKASDNEMRNNRNWNAKNADNK